MIKEDNIIVPRWFLEIVEDTLRIENNINEPDKKETGESCQDRNIRQSLNGIRKLLNGEELTGMERLEKLRSCILSDIDNAVEKMYPMTTTPPTPTEVAAYHNAAQQKLRDAFKAGAEWRDAQIPKLPNNLDEVAENRVTENGRFKITSFEKMRIEDIMFGAEWMAKQGETVEGYITDEIAYNGIAVILDNEEQFKPGDKVIVQIRKKEE